MDKSIINPIEILLVERNFKNIDLVVQLLDKTQFQYKLHISNSISEAVDIFKKSGNYKNMPKPDLIFFHSEPTNDYEKRVLKEINNNKIFSPIPLLILKITNNKIEIIKAINKQFKYNSTKELDIEYFIETIISLKQFMGSLHQARNRKSDKINKNIMP